MASPNIFTGGLGGVSGATLAIVSPLYTSGEVWYLHGPSGTDAASPAGKERNKPLATLAQALTNAGNNDTIVCLSGHTETLTATATIAETGLSIVGEGTGSSRPKFTRNVNGVLFDVTGAAVTIDNIYFPGGAASTTSGKVSVASVGSVVRNCYFEASVLDDGGQLEFTAGAGQCRVRGCTFISTAATVADQPSSALRVVSAMSDLWIGGPETAQAVVVDGGSSGWSATAALNVTAAVTRLRIQNVDLLNDSDINIVTATTGFVHVRNKTGSARVVWAA